ncbi:hypothetical protein EK21DRAFT_93004 [Setomelanomma holmii]|uniref:Uncharacterized protein n=1 Tax=Setomelanomma holmii TaxID=210430 RepID=A0A9P4LIK6_9PLEO|nr:hypothetical protein EK21DRAFT_93004 [Setomelanomma holmii]
MSTTSIPSPSHECDAPFPDFDITYEEPLYTEINIPLPRLPSPSRNAVQSSSSALASTSQTQQAQPSHSRSRARSLSSFSPFRPRSFSSASSTSRNGTDATADPWPRIRPSKVKNREVAAAMDLKHQNKRNRSSTIDALAVVPAVLVLSAELFTPGSGRDGKGGKEGKRKDSGVGRWEDAVR